MTNYTAAVSRAAFRRAAEIGGAYSVTDEAQPFADVADELASLDRSYARIIGRLIAGADRLVRETGLSPEVWLAQTARVPRADRRMLLTAADLLGRMPHTLARFNEGWLSWGQIRAIVLAVRRLPQAALAHADQAISVGAITFADAEPEALLDRVDNLVSELDHLRAEKSEARTREGNFLWLQPFLDGTGGKAYGEFDAISFGLLDQALDSEMVTPELTRDDGTDAQTAANNRQSITAVRADALLAICANSLSGDGKAGKPSRPTLFVHTSLRTLLGLSTEPAQILTTLTGGRLRLTSAALRDLVANQGADVRLTIIDHGHVIGVGHKNRLASGWLADAIRTLHTECVHPGCRRPARKCAIDHGHEWADDGPTDEDNLSPLCTKHNNDKTRGRFTLSRADAQGQRRWRHPSGLTTTIHPDPEPLLADGTDPPG